MEIYRGPLGDPLRRVFTFIIPVLVVVNVPARLMAQPFQEGNILLAVFTLVATAGSLVGSRWLFNRAWKVTGVRVAENRHLASNRNVRYKGVAHCCLNPEP